MAINPANLDNPMRVAFVVCPNMLATSITLPNEMLRAAADLAASRRRAPDLHIELVAATGTATTRCGIPLQGRQPAECMARYDLVYLPALWRNPGRIMAGQASLLPWLTAQYGQGALIGAVGTGVCLLAETGLLDGRPATTHWFYLDAFARQYPHVDLKRQHLITRSGNLYCAASINALADLTVHFIRHFHGSSVARHVERHFSHEARQSYDAITYREEETARHHDEDIIQIQLWLQQHLAQGVNLAQVAGDFGLTVRSFNRRFRAATGKTPLQYLQHLRVEEGRDLLKHSNLTIAEVADKVGYQDSSHFTRLFQQHLNVTPQEYRKSLRRKLFSLDPAAASQA